MTDARCALCGQQEAESRSVVVVQVDDPDRRWSVRVHGSCLTSFLAAHLPPLLADRSVRIPSDAACGVCGERLPIVGRHPYAVTVVEEGLDRTWFVHAECLSDTLRTGLPGP